MYIVHVHTCALIGGTISAIALRQNRFKSFFESDIGYDLEFLSDYMDNGLYHIQFFTVIEIRPLSPCTKKYSNWLPVLICTKK